MTRKDFNNTHGSYGSNNAILNDIHAIMQFTGILKDMHAMMQYNATYPRVPCQYQSNESFATSYQLQERKQDCSIVAPLANGFVWK